MGCTKYDDKETYLKWGEKTEQSARKKKTLNETEASNLPNA